MSTDVLIVGAGPTGLALGIDLARRGVDALVVERAGELFPGSRGKGIQPRTMEVFDDLGVLDAIHAAGGGYPVGMIWQDGQRVGEHRMFDPVEATEDSPYDEPWMVPQWRTQRILFDRLEELGGRVAFGLEATGIEQDANGVTVRLSAHGESSDGSASLRRGAGNCATSHDGPAAGNRPLAALPAVLRARYVVAADGGRSAVRRALGIGMTGETVDPNPTLVADARISGLDRDNWHIFPPRGEGDGFLAICPLAGTEDFQVTAQFPEGSSVDLSLEGVRKVVAARSHLAPKDVTEVRWASDFRPRAALADRFRDGRVFLAGDAAHIHSPAGGQGLNTSVQDAYNLGWKLGAVLRDGVDEALLETYEEERRPVAADMLGLSTSVHRGEVRRGVATRQLGLGYRESSLTAETRQAPAALRAGDRAPDGTLGGVRLFDAFRGPHWTLLAVGVEAPELPGPVGVVRGPAQESYGTGLFLVRPDGYVGWAGDTADGLPRYLARAGL
ncbi:FAD-dependent oxidoreductase [Streptomyces chartreusis]|uniref:FAD-dependent oxidoreductase n=1 Tax=Streptomyces chartreusis TaxID=1969 RepID=UPI00123CDD24|nr:FAD-dependent oxidoreductase [Streptomyces chartreusis]QEV68099.1 pentachlorophenol monooxygenase [Streptomyces chartreusis]